jgi:glycerol uptake facilitator-like aquaporin
MGERGVAGRPSLVVGPIVGPCVGGVLGGAVYDLLVTRHHPAQEVA